MKLRNLMALRAFTFGPPHRPLATVPTLNEWARVNFRPTTPTVTGRRPASHRLRRQRARDMRQQGIPGAGQYHMEMHAKLMTMTPEEAETYDGD